MARISASRPPRSEARRGRRAAAERRAGARDRRARRSDSESSGPAPRSSLRRLCGEASSNRSPVSSRSARHRSARAIEQHRVGTTGVRQRLVRQRQRRDRLAQIVDDLRHGRCMISGASNARRRAARNGAASAQAARTFVGDLVRPTPSHGPPRVTVPHRYPLHGCRPLTAASHPSISCHARATGRSPSVTPTSHATAHAPRVGVNTTHAALVSSHTSTANTAGSRPSFTAPPAARTATLPRPPSLAPLAAWGPCTLMSMPRRAIRWRTGKVFDAAVRRNFWRTRTLGPFSETRLSGEPR